MALTVDPFMAILAAFIAALVTEVLSWIIVYRTGSYKRLKEELDRNSRKLEAIKQSSTAVAAAKPSRSNKKEKRLEENMKTGQRDMTASRMKLTFITTACMMLTYQFISAKWDGVVVAKLPFSPPKFLQTLTHRGLTGDDPTDCSAAFIFAMSSAYFKQNMTKLAPWSLSRAAARAMAPSAAMNADKYK